MEEKLNVLIVDDEEDNLALLYRTLRKDFSIRKSTSPIEALRMLDEMPADIILSDHKMPEMDGVEFLKLCSLKCPRSVRLLVTAYSDVSILIDAINYANIYRYVKKPWLPDELLMIVQAAAEYYILKRDNEKLIQDLKDLFTGTVNAIVEALDTKNNETVGKSKRVAYYSVKMANYFNFSKEDCSKIELAGLLHDIGMIGVSEAILNKKAELTAEEYDKVKRHVNHSIKILEDIKQLREVVEIIKYHHERYDGSGYPFGLSGESIPIYSAIISVADAFDSMTSYRPFRESRSPEEALREIEEQSGKQFNPRVVEAFRIVFDSLVNPSQNLDEAGN